MSSFRCLSVGFFHKTSREETDHESWIWNGTGEESACLNWNVVFLLGWLLQFVEKMCSKGEYTEMAEMF